MTSAPRNVDIPPLTLILLDRSAPRALGTTACLRNGRDANEALSVHHLSHAFETSARRRSVIVWRFAGNGRGGIDAPMRSRVARSSAEGCRSGRAPRYSAR